MEFDDSWQGTVAFNEQNARKLKKKLKRANKKVSRLEGLVEGLTARVLMQEESKGGGGLGWEVSQIVACASSASSSASSLAFFSASFAASSPFFCFSAASSSIFFPASRRTFSSGVGAVAFGLWLANPINNPINNHLSLKKKMQQRLATRKQSATLLNDEDPPTEEARVVAFTVQALTVPPNIEEVCIGMTT
jgi:hypothetical protein